MQVFSYMQILNAVVDQPARSTLEWNWMNKKYVLVEFQFLQQKQQEYEPMLNCRICAARVHGLSITSLGLGSLPCCALLDKLYLLLRRILVTSQSGFQTT